MQNDPAAFRSAFALFQNVLESNNRALETITDMGDKLGGDYLFDIVYVRQAYGQLMQDMQHSLDQFRVLTKNRYAELDGSYKRIHSLIIQALEETTGSPEEYVVALDTLPRSGTFGVGGKMGPLAEVKNRLHMEVPDGFTITTAAFDEYLRFNGIDGEIARASADELTDLKLAHLHEAILHGAMPPDVGSALVKGLTALARKHPSALLALRSSAVEEDGDHSFAGQFTSVLGVPQQSFQVELAYRRVVASLFSGKAAAYAGHAGIPLSRLKMAVGCMVMVNAVTSGVAYTSMPEGDQKHMMISAAWGLGETVVEAGTGTDQFILTKDPQPEVVKSTIHEKKSMVIARELFGTKQIDVTDERKVMPSLTGEKLMALGRKAAAIERHFGAPRDIEWAVDRNGVIWILQARPLTIRHGEAAQPAVITQGKTTIMENTGTVVQQGVGAGTVFIAKKPTDIIDMPKGAVLVATHDSSLFVQGMTSVSAIITEQGSEASHMAALSRELKVPTIVNASRATHLLKHGQTVTVVADKDKPAVYEGIIQEALAAAGQDLRKMEAVYEYRRKRYILRYISMLHLIDPLMNEFTPERCRTMHDILRFMHEKAVAALIETAREAGRSFRKRNGILPLDLPVPAGILVMDLGGGLVDGGPAKSVGQDMIASVPFRAILRGMLRPGAWRADPVQLKAGDFLSSMMRMPDISSAEDSTAGYNVAVISADYVNMSIRFGYHFNMIDCFCSDKPKNNHLYFRFAGGATDLVKRSRRLELIGRILESFGMSVKIKGDLLIGRISGLPKNEMEPMLEKTGTLMAYARQLDAVLHDDRAVDRYEKQFLEGNYVF